MRLDRRLVRSKRKSHTTSGSYTNNNDPRQSPTEKVKHQSIHTFDNDTALIHTSFVVYYFSASQRLTRQLHAADLVKQPSFPSYSPDRPVGFVPHHNCTTFWFRNTVGENNIDAFAPLHKEEFPPLVITLHWLFSTILSSIIVHLLSRHVQTLLSEHRVKARVSRKYTPNLHTMWRMTQ